MNASFDVPGIICFHWLNCREYASYLLYCHCIAYESHHITRISMSAHAHSFDLHFTARTMLSQDVSQSDTLFRQILTNPNHVLAHLLPEKVNTHYQLRPRQHDRQLIPRTTNLYSCNFVIRMLYKHSYWLYFIVHSLTVLITFILLLSYIVQVAFWQLDIKRRWWW